jgi:uncharacterized protein
VELAEKLRTHREDILRAAALRGARNVRVFGSVARGEARPDSDVDFLVEFEPGRNLLDWGGLWSDLEAIMGCEIDVVSEDSIHPLIRERVLKEAVPV